MGYYKGSTRVPLKGSFMGYYMGSIRAPLNIL